MKKTPSKVRRAFGRALGIPGTLRPLRPCVLTPVALTPEIRAFLLAGTRNGVPGELTIRIKASKVISHFDMTG